MRKLKTPGLGYIIFFMFLFVSAQYGTAQIVWDGGGDGFSWHDQDNWVGNVSPTVLDSAVINIPASVTVDGLSSARSVYLGGAVIVDQSATPNWTDVLDIASGARYDINGGDWDWKTVHNRGLVVVEGFPDFKDSIEVFNHLNAEIRISTSRQIDHVDAIIDNNGLIALGSSGDIFTPAGTLHTLINRSSGVIRKLGVSQSDIRSDITNFGLIEAVEGGLDLKGINVYEANSTLNAEAGHLLHCQLGQSTFNGFVSGSPDGEVRISGNYFANNATIDFSNQGIFIYGDFVGGGQLTNDGKMYFYSTVADIRDSSELINNDTIIVHTSDQINLVDGTIDNFGTLILESSGDIFTPAGSLHVLINRPGAVIQKIGGSTSIIAADITNFGHIAAVSGSLTLNGTNIFEANSTLDVAAGRELVCQLELTTFNGLVSGSPAGSIEMRGNYASNNGTLNFSDQGIFITSDFVGGGTLTNQAKMSFYSTVCDILDSSMLINHDTLIVNVSDQINLIDGIIDNYGILELKSSGDIFTPAGNLHTLINRSSGIIVSTGGTGSDITADLTNYGLISSLDGGLDLFGDNLFEANSVLNAEPGAPLGCDLGHTTFNGRVSGSPAGTITLKSDYSSNSGILDFSNTGIFITGDLVGGGTLTNDGKMTFFSTACDIRDSSTLINNDTIIVNTSDQINLIDGTIDNYGILMLLSSGDIFNPAGSLHKVINRSTGVIQNFGGSQSDIRADLTNYGHIATFEGGLELEGNNTFEDNSSLYAAAGWSINNQLGMTTINGAVTGNAEGAIFLSNNYTSSGGSIEVINNGISVYADLVDGGTLTNEGKMTFPGTTADIRDSSTLINNDTIIVNSSSQINLIDGVIDNFGSLILNSTGDIFTPIGSLHELINRNSGTIENFGSSQSAIQANITNHGTIRTEQYELVLSGAVSNETSGRFEGAGIIDIGSASFTNSGTTAAGLSPGTLTFQGAYEQDAQGTLEVEIDGTIAGTQYDRVVTTSFANLAGNIDVTLGYQPTPGQTFDIVSSSFVNSCAFDDTVTTCYNDEINAFAVHCLAAGLRLEYTGLRPNKVGCKNIDVYLDAAGNFTVDPFTVLNDSVEICGIDNLALSDPDFDCADVNATLTRTLTMSSLSTVTNCNTEITVYDTIKPVANCKSGLTFDLDAAGNLTLTGNDIDNASSDNCPVVLSLNQSSFNCSDIGMKQVILTATDAGGNSDNCATQIEVRDVTPPVIVVNNPVNVTLDDETGVAVLTPAMVDNGTADVCGIVQSISISQQNFDCNSPDMLNLTFTAEDEYGNMTSVPFTVNVIKPQKSVAWVNDDAAGANNGLTPSSAFTNLRVALSAPGCYTTLDTVKVIAGSYFPDNLGPANRNSTFDIPDGVTLIGGYSPDGSTFDPGVHLTILDGDIGAAGSADNVYNVVTIPSATASSELNGFIIHNGNADDVVKNAGAGIYANGTSILKNLTVQDNQSTGDGSGLFISAPGGNVSFGTTVTLK